MHGELARIVTDLVDGFGDARQLDVVDQFANPFPVTVVEQRTREPLDDMLSEPARRLGNPRLDADPPPNRRNAVLRGPRHLAVTFDELRP